jgi:azurin
VKELGRVVADDLTGPRFGCTVPGHVMLMQGDLTVTP